MKTTLSEIVAANVRYYVALDSSEKGRGGAKLARMMGWKPDRCRAIMSGRAYRATTMDEIAAMAERFHISVVDLCRPRSELSAGLPSAATASSRASQTESWKVEQCRAFGSDLARALWESAGDGAQIGLLLDSEFHVRATHEFWDKDKQLFAARWALKYLADAIGTRFPVRDRFPYRERLPFRALIQATDLTNMDS